MDSLPDDILIHILSFLPMKQAASTSVLSKRWRTLFAFTHNLVFDYPFHHSSEINWEVNWEDKWRKSQKIFRDFVYRTLALQAGSHVKKLSLTIKTWCDRVGVLNHWIRYALKHGVSELNLSICEEMSSLTRVFTSTTLVRLSLGSFFTIKSLPLDICLPSLKVLLVDKIEFRIRGQLSDLLLPACPVLEDLNIHHRYYYGFTDVLSSKTIKNLYYSGIPMFKYYQFDLLVKATLDIRCHRVTIGKNVGKLISGICNVKTLHLTISAVEVILKWCKDELPMFNNLVDLVFSSKKQGWRVLLPRLLECSPNLKVLVLSGLHRYTSHRRFVGIQIPLENQIEMISIKKYQGSANELKHIRHILRNMKRLKVLKIYVALTMDETKKMQLTEDLMKLSSKVKITSHLIIITNEL